MFEEVFSTIDIMFSDLETNVICSALPKIFDEEDAQIVVYFCLSLCACVENESTMAVAETCSLIPSPRRSVREMYKCYGECMAHATGCMTKAETLYTARDVLALLVIRYHHDALEADRDADAAGGLLIYRYGMGDVPMAELVRRGMIDLSGCMPEKTGGTRTLAHRDVFKVWQDTEGLCARIRKRLLDPPLFGSKFMKSSIARAASLRCHHDLDDGFAYDGISSKGEALLVHMLASGDSGVVDYVFSNCDRRVLMQLLLKVTLLCRREVEKSVFLPEIVMRPVRVSKTIDMLYGKDYAVSKLFDLCGKINEEMYNIAMVLGGGVRTLEVREKKVDPVQLKWLLHALRHFFVFCGEKHRTLT